MMLPLSATKGYTTTPCSRARGVTNSQRPRAETQVSMYKKAYSIHRKLNDSGPSQHSCQSYLVLYYVLVLFPFPKSPPPLRKPFFWLTPSGEDRVIKYHMPIPRQAKCKINLVPGEQAASDSGYTVESCRVVSTERDVWARSYDGTRYCNGVIWRCLHNKDKLTDSETFNV
jgi:hypothetical protein